MGQDAAGGPAGDPSPAGGAAGDRDWRKPAWRRHLLAEREQRGADPARDAARADLVLALPQVVAARTVAAYVSFGTEPATDLLLAALLDRGVRVLLPLLRPDRDLDWTLWSGVEGRGRTEAAGPVGAPLGAAAVTTADVIVCPGLAVDRAGRRLGRGGGSYDRALARTRPGALRVLLLDDAEVVDRLPADPHDEPVHVAITATRVLRLDSPG